MKFLHRFFTLIFCCIAVCSFAQNPQSDSLKTNNLADEHLTAAKINLSKSKSVIAFTELIKADELYKKVGNKLGEANVKIAYADFYSSKFSWVKADSSYRQALALAEHGGDSVLIGNIAFKLAKACLEEEQFDQAEKFTNHAIAQFTKAGLKTDLGNSYVQLSAINRLQGNLTQAENIILKKALQKFGSYAPERIPAFDLLGHIYQEKKLYPQSKWFFIQANTLARRLKDTSQIIASLTNLGKVKVLINDNDLALRDFKEAESLVKATKNIQQSVNLKKAFSNLYLKLGNKTAANRYSDVSGTLSDSIKKLETIQTESASVVKTLAQKEIKKQIVQTKKTAVVKKNNKGAFIIIGVLTLCIIVIAVFAYSRKKKTRKKK